MAGKRDRLSGNEAIAIALRQINPDVFPAFPITPSTEIPQYFASFVANGQVDTEFIPVESEHSSMSAAIGASAAGARSLTATSSCGLAYMWEELYIAASNRLPLALALVNRALSGPININCDHSDSMGARDAGWIQIYAENNQEAYDNMVQAFRISVGADSIRPLWLQKRMVSPCGATYFARVGKVGKAPPGDGSRAFNNALSRLPRTPCFFYGGATKGRVISIRRGKRPGYRSSRRPLRSRWRLCRLTDAAYPLRIHR